MSKSISKKSTVVDFGKLGKYWKIETNLIVTLWSSLILVAILFTPPGHLMWISQLFLLAGGIILSKANSYSCKAMEKLELKEHCNDEAGYIGFFWSRCYYCFKLTKSSSSEQWGPDITNDFGSLKACCLDCYSTPTIANELIESLKTSEQNL